jgi:hypothetical protein
MSREAMQLALEALEKVITAFGSGLTLQQNAINALRQALETEREWVGLTDEQVEDEWERITGHSIFGGDRSEGRAMYISPDEVIEFSRAIEAKLKDKNT